jgi:hypothetical protein
MAQKIFATRFYEALIGANILLLIWFWWYFFAHASPFQAGPPAWGKAVPWMIVLNRGLGSSLSMLKQTTIPIFQVSLIVYLPCFLVTWPIVRFLSPEFLVFGTNPQGIRMIMVTVLSFAQWAFLLRIGSFLLRTLQYHRTRQNEH